MPLIAVRFASSICLRSSNSAFCMPLAAVSFTSLICLRSSATSFFSATFSTSSFFSDNFSSLISSPFLFSNVFMVSISPIWSLCPSSNCVSRSVMAFFAIFHFPICCSTFSNPFNRTSMDFVLVCSSSV